MKKYKNKLIVAFLVDSNKTLGLGHLKRCLSLAESLSKNHMTSIFLISNNNKEEIEKYGHRVFKINHNLIKRKSIKKILELEKCKILIVDSKRKSILGILKSVKNDVKIILIDNLQFNNYADLIVLPGMHEQFRTYPKNCLVGPKYVIINHELKNQMITKKKKMILLSTGGADKKNITMSIVSAFKKITLDFKLFVILGKFYSNDKKLYALISNDKRFIVIREPQNFSRFMNECSIGIVTFGVTVYEAAFTRLPIFVISHSIENHISAKRIVDYGWFKYLGKYDEVNYLKTANEIISILHNDGLLAKMSLSGRLIDGKGADRISKAILKLSNE